MVAKIKRIKRKCDNKCFYFPDKSTSVDKEYVNDYGVKFRKSTFLCGFNENTISCYKDCENYTKLIRGGNEQ